MSWQSQTGGSGYRIFTFVGVPIYAGTSYLFLLVLFMFLAGKSPIWGDAHFIIFGLCMTLSLLAHELGHALVAKKFGLEPRVVLHSMGGVCFHKPTSSRTQDVLVTAAGPGAGFLLAGLAYITGTIMLSVQPALLVKGAADPAIAQLLSDVSLNTIPWEEGLLEPTGLTDIIRKLLWMNIAWSIFNLIPIWPLDGGQLLRSGLEKFLGQKKAIKPLHGTGLVLSGLLLMYALSGMSLWLAFIAAVLGWENLQVLNIVGNLGGAGRATSKAVKQAGDLTEQMLREAGAAMSRGNWREAVRLMHQMRADGAIDRASSELSYQILGLAYTAMGEYEEALDYLNKAPLSPEVDVARQQCESALNTGST
jgi:stage IV sporulation protein FB